MKKVLSAVLLTSIVAALFCGCAADSGIELESYPQPLSIHTDDQYSFIESDDVSVIEVYADGRAEKSRPQPITLEWKDGKNSSNYTVEISEKENFSEYEEYTVTDCSLSVYNLKISTDYYWRVKSDAGVSKTGTFSVSGDKPRNIYVDGVTNVRDIGGYSTLFGKKIKQGLIYRGGRLNKSDVNDDGYATPPKEFVPEITEAGKSTFKDVLKIKTEIDLRLLNRNGYPDGMPLKSTVEGVDYESIPMNGNALIVNNGEVIKQFMEFLADESRYPIYFHCNIGTDRTGMLSYLLEGLCGVDEKDMLKDYLFSNYGNIGEYKAPENSKNKFVKQLGENGDYEGDNIAERVENYFQSIGVSPETYNAVRDILLGN